jgi:hypothetical protein
LRTVPGCKKCETPSNNNSYVGDWLHDADDGVFKLSIKDDGTPQYDETHVGTFKSVGGYIYFDGYDFKIGLNLINKKFKANDPPKRVTISVKPYKYFYKATFNGIEYKKN